MFNGCFFNIKVAALLQILFTDPVITIHGVIFKGYYNIPSIEVVGKSTTHILYTTEMRCVVNSRRSYWPRYRLWYSRSWVILSLLYHGIKVLVTLRILAILWQHMLPKVSRWAVSHIVRSHFSSFSSSQFSSSILCCIIYRLLFSCI